MTNWAGVFLLLFFSSSSTSSPFISLCHKMLNQIVKAWILLTTQFYCRCRRLSEGTSCCCFTSTGNGTKYILLIFNLFIFSPVGKENSIDKLYQWATLNDTGGRWGSSTYPKTKHKLNLKTKQTNKYMNLLQSDPLDSPARTAPQSDFLWPNNSWVKGCQTSLNANGSRSYDPFSPFPLLARFAKCHSATLTFSLLLWKHDAFCFFKLLNNLPFTHPLATEKKKKKC